MAHPAETAATTPGVGAPPSAPVRVGPWPMWVLGLVVLIDQVDQNLVRGVVPQLKSDFGIDDFGIGPRRGHADRLHLGITDDAPPDEKRRLFEHGPRRFIVDMMKGLRDDLRVIISIPTLKFAFFLVTPPVFLGAYLLYRARDHLDVDAAKIFEAIVRDMQQEQDRASP